MFVVRAIQKKNIQKTICEEVGATYYENALAFFAADLKENKTDIDSYISICQFYLNGDGEIISFSAANGRENDEAVIVMLRTVMSFMHRCGVKNAYFAKNSTSEFWLKKSGFISTDGVYSIDLDKFYTSPCCHDPE